jgi:2-polyprenyl-6-methoxyphenol hydroxylase-like FAD-dependent oxidoreductase
MKGRVLVTGASVAGVTAAWWLARQGMPVDLVERVASFRDGGQNVDVRGAGRAVLRRMALEQAALDLSTSEYGTDLVDSDNQVIARFGVDEGGDRGPTAELKIRRGDIARLIYDDLGDGVDARFGDHVAGIAQDLRKWPPRALCDGNRRRGGRVVDTRARLSRRERSALDGHDRRLFFGPAPRS